MTITTQYYKHRVDLAFKFISDSLERQNVPSLELISDKVGLSKFHFHRVFKLVTGETLQQTISRIKLSKATIDLAKDNVSVTEAAMNAGFESSQSLAKALKRELSVTATQLKNEPERLAQTLVLLSLPNPNKSDTGLVSIELTSLEPFEYIAVPTEGSYPELNEIYHYLFNAVGDPGKVSAILGVPECNAGLLDGEGAVFDCGLLLNQSSETTDSKVIDKKYSGGDFIRVRHNGSFAGLDETLDKMYSSLLTQEKVELVDQPCLFHYLDDPEEVSEDNLRTDIYIAVSAL